ncbi:MAG: DUF6146 family protein [Bacteroidota bacterium]
MKRVFLKSGLLALLLVLIYACGAGKETAIELSEAEKEIFNYMENDTVTIADEDSEYEIIIIDPGFNQWLRTIPKPEGYYSQNYLENRNQILVTNWNLRATQPFNFDPDLYLMQIDYDSQIDYGYEVNYKLYFYFVYFQRRYNQRLGPWLPRI